ncbi:MAG: Uroporphyrinogen decarboxylase [Chlamydiales bacterium]|jgi:uroporphyrinogen decarboxylase|nr:Uroporphyrinogen decarboxylase [Chlamydiales bacterium]
MQHLFMQALAGKNQSRPPVWLMRQAGRYMPEYQAIRKKASFLEICRNPELIAEVTELPLTLLGIDALILFSDILLISESWGLSLAFDDKKGPRISGYVSKEEPLRELPKPDIASDFTFLTKGIELIKKAHETPLIGFSGGPFTIASYLIEGGTSRDFRETKKRLYQDPEGMHRLLDQITDGLIELLLLQIDAGVEAVQVFESWAHTLSTPHFEAFCLPYLQKIGQALQEKDVLHLFFCRGASLFYPQIAALKPTGIGLDWHIPIDQVRKNVPLPIALQGNLDPCVLYAPKEEIQRQVKLLLKAMEHDPAFIVNLGHGVLPDVPVDSVKCFVDTVKGD